MIQAGDAKSWILCRRRAWFDHNPPSGFAPAAPSAFDQLVLAAGRDHEDRIAAHLAATVGPVARAGSVERTKALMKAAAPVIAQAVLDDVERDLGGRADFLTLQLDGGYRVEDAKLAGSLDGHAEIRLQLAVYRRLLGSDRPAVVWLGSGEQALVGDESDAEAAVFIEEFSEALARLDPPSATFGESKCGACPYDAHCRPLFQQAGEPTLLHGVNAVFAAKLRLAGVDNIATLATADADQPLPGFQNHNTWRRAVLQARAVETDRMFMLHAPALPEGTWVHFDVEADPLSATSGGEVYLWGLLPPPHGLTDFEGVWSEGGPAADQAAWQAFLLRVAELRSHHSSLVLSHYASYERTQIKLYASRYGDEQHPIAKWLLGDESPLFDLRTEVLRCLVLPVPGYGLKTICKHPQLVNFQWELTESGSQWSVVRYAEYRRLPEGASRAAIRAEIETYNRDDVRATRALELWLRGLNPQEYAP